MTTTEPRSDSQSQASPLFDVIVVGAGIHGASMACEASSRGLKTLLIQSGKLGGTASCVPSDVLGAGLNLLENLQLPEVMANRDALRCMHRKAPHLVKPIDAFIVKAPSVRSGKKVNVGIRIYNRLQNTRPSALNDEELSKVFHDSRLFNKPIREYSVNYVRIVIALVQQLQCNDEAQTLLNHRLVGAQRNDDAWILEVDDLSSKRRSQVRASVLINCTGCHSNDLLKNVLKVASRSSATRLNSAQIYVNLAQHWRSAAIFQRANNSLVYAHNFDNQHLCIGPILAESDDEDAKAQAVDELLALWNQHTCTPLQKEDIVHCRWSSHPLAEDPSLNKLSSTNTTFLDLNNPGQAAPLLNLFGNNLVQYRKIAEQGLDILEPFTRAKRNALYASEKLPGGDFEGRELEDVYQQLCDRYDFLSQECVTRLVNTYGSNAIQILNDCQCENDMGRHFGAGLYEREVSYLRDYEWVESAEDILWRRTYLGLRLSPDEQRGLAKYLLSP